MSGSDALHVMHLSKRLTADVVRFVCLFHVHQNGG
jgi:hypothetical protein